MQDDATRQMDLERAEFEALVAAFSSAPRSLRLLRYIGDNYFAGTLTELCEFSIATEVCGRPKSQFNPAEDAIARAETHRLRKRLKDYYREKGRNHTLHFSLPPATYVPVFIHADDTPARLEDTAYTETEDSRSHEISMEVPRADEEDQAHRSIARVIPIFRERRQMLIAMGTAIMVVGFIVFALSRIGRHRESERIETAQVVSATAVPAPAIRAPEPVRLDRKSVV